MSEENKSLINIKIDGGGLTKPACLLIEKISDAIGGLARPWQIRRIAEAEADANKIQAASQIEISELERRAMLRWFGEEAQKQQNIESITQKAIPNLQENSQPQNVENDWIVNFFDKCRLVSDEQMQILWGKILAGEANSPGRYTKRTINALSSLDKMDAKKFSKLCSYNVILNKRNTVLIFNSKRNWNNWDSIYQKNKIHCGFLEHLDDIGLISFNSTGGYARMFYKLPIEVVYHNRQALIKGFSKATGIHLGLVNLTKVGEELVKVVNITPIDEFFPYVIDKLTDDPSINIEVTS